jgi:hypothetical protein
MEQKGYSSKPIWAGGDQPVQQDTSEQLFSFTKAGLITGGIGAAGWIPFKRHGKSYKIWDLYTEGLRTAEEYSPGKVLRTFQASNIASQFETAALQTKIFRPEDITKLDPKLMESLSSLTGQDFFSSRISNQGFRFQDNKLVLGVSGNIVPENILLQNAAWVRNINKSARFTEGYYRALNLEVPKGMFEQAVQYTTETGQAAEEVGWFIGGRTRSEHLWRQTRGVATELVERMNRLARAPIENEPFATIFRKFQKFGLAADVVPGSEWKTMGRLIGKLGFVGAGAYLGYQWIDWKARESTILDKTIFEEGVTAAGATTWAKTNLALHNISDKLGITEYGARQEEIAPGSTSFSRLLAFPIMGSLAGVGIHYGQRVHQQAKFQYHGGVEEVINPIVNNWAQGVGDDSPLFNWAAKHSKKVSYDAVTSARTAASKIDRAIYEGGIKTGTDWSGDGLFAKLGRKLGTVNTLDGVVERNIPLIGKLTPAKLKLLIGAAAGTALIAPFIPGALAPERTGEELEALYTGQEEVPIRRGRWWELSRSPWEGGKISYFRPHWYRRMLDRGAEKSMWGPLEEEGEELSPYQKFVKKEFSYELEQAHYHDRPYPITGTSLEDIPLVGPLLGKIVGGIWKPPKLMHSEEWLRSKDGTGAKLAKEDLSKWNKQVALQQAPGYGGRVATEMGEESKGMPISPYSWKGVAGEQIYRFTEQIGLPGFIASAVKERITGSPDWFDQEMQLESARRMYGAERAYWDKNIGGGLFSTEFLRRLVPHRRRQIELYNPIKNTMPNWLPGAGDRSPDFQTGDPFVKVEEGELRLPGAGYASRFPELEGVDPKDYPIAHRYKILGDIAPYSEKFRETQAAMMAIRARGGLDEREEELYTRTRDQLKRKKIGREFFDYKYRDRRFTPAREKLEEDIEAPRENFLSRMVGSYWENLAHNAETPFEYLTPASPANKLVHMRTAVEDYEKKQVFGTENAFWQHPVRDFFRPLITSTVGMVNKAIPEHVEERRGLDEYFDMLEWIKQSRLRNIAIASEDGQAASIFQKRKRETLFGLDPYTFNYESIFRALPRNERDYFNRFADADLDERKKIQEMVPENEKGLYQARWELTDAQDLAAAAKKGKLSQREIDKAKDDVADLFTRSDTEGFEKDKTLWQEYIQTRNKGEGYPDWYRRTKLLSKALAGKPLPGPNWVGWHPSVDLKDVELKVIENLGKDYHEYDMWPSQKASLERKPYIDDEAAEEITEGASLSPGEIRERVLKLLSGQLEDVQVFVTPIQNASSNEINLDIQEDRSEEIAQRMRRGRT